MRFRLLASMLLLGALSAACENIDHPASAPPCDPAVTNCMVVPGGHSADGDGGGAAGGDEELVSWSGQVLTFRDDFFDQGSLFNGRAQVSATGENRSRVKAVYDGNGFQLANVLQTSANWFLVEPEQAPELLPTISPVDTRVTRQTELGLARAEIVDEIFALSLAGAERATSRAQIALFVVDEQNRAVSGMRAAAGAEMTAYRDGVTWTTEESAATDGTGLIFMGNVPVGSALGVQGVTLSGAVSARVDVFTSPGAVTVARVVVSPP